MKHEYHEGLKAGENFEKLAGAVFQHMRVKRFIALALALIYLAEGE